MTIRKVDSSGRVLLGRRYANRQVIVEKRPGRVLITPLPEGLLAGLADAKARRFAEPPELPPDTGEQ